jgi:hypothetical protein
MALPPLNTPANPLREIEVHDLFGAGHDRLDALPEVNDTATVPPVPALQHTHGKTTSGFAGSEPPVPFRGRPPERNARPLERQDYLRSLDYATEAMATTATPSSTFTPSALPPLLLPLPMVRPLVGCKHLAPAVAPPTRWQLERCRLQGAPMWTICPRSHTTPVSLA